jgi:hypothetical protein
LAGTRVPLRNLFDCLKAGDAIDDSLDLFPSVTRERAISAREPAREALRDRSGRRDSESDQAAMRVVSRVRSFSGNPHVAPPRPNAPVDGRSRY